jgi:hypothetical protein
MSAVSVSAIHPKVSCRTGEDRLLLARMESEYPGYDHRYVRRLSPSQDV